MPSHLPIYAFPSLIHSPQNSAADERALNLGLVELHQLSPYPLAFDNPKTMGDRLQGGHAFRSTLGTQLENRMIGRTDFYPRDELQLGMTGVKLARLSPRAVRDDKLDRPIFLLDQGPIQFDRVRRGIEQNAPVIRS